MWPIMNSLSSHGSSQGSSQESSDEAEGDIRKHLNANKWMAKDVDKLLIFP